MSLNSIKTTLTFRDPRLFQIASLTTLFMYGLVWLDFDVSILQIIVTIGSALLTQYAGTRFCKLPAFDPKSPLISALSLCLLLRTNAIAVAALAAFVAIASKFVIRWKGKHLFNPTALALTIVIATDLGWVSAGQWGREAVLGFLIACLGTMVVSRAARSDTSVAFLATYSTLLFGRALWLGDPFTIPLHQLETGALLLFAFFMISDPKTTPDSRLGRLVHGGFVTLGAYAIQFTLYRPNALLWSLIGLAPFVPLLDRWLPGTRYSWKHVPSHTRPQVAMVPHHAAAVSLMTKEGLMRRVIPFAMFALMLVGWAPQGSAFCGFYVAKADTKLFNKASEVVIVRHDDKTVITMANDFRGDVKEFAMVIPVPTLLTKEQIHVGEPAILKHLADYSAPRLVEYYDANPCLEREELKLFDGMRRSMAPASEAQKSGRAKALGLTIEAQYEVGEYDILILSAKESAGLETWLTENGYRIPNGASPVLKSYLKQGMRFFVAKVNLDRHTQMGFAQLRPLQIAFESPKFMLPIRLGTVNADGAQELFVYTLTHKGRVETTNYRTIRLPEAQEIPVYVKDKFGDFYRDLFAQQVKRENKRGVFLEYAWDMNWCDPCAANPLSSQELRKLGVFWLEEPSAGRRGQAQNVYLTRLHVRYDAAHFPEDLMFQETSDRGNFQARYIIRHPWQGTEECDGAKRYREQLRTRYERDAQTLAHLTGWNLEDIRRTMNIDALPVATPQKWYQRLWQD